MRIAALAVLLLAGCQTTLDPNYALQLESYRLTITSQQNVEVAKAHAEAARYQAMSAIAERGNEQSRQMAILALALARSGGDTAKLVPAVLPNPPETQEDKALRWAAIFAGPVISVAQGYFGYRLGVTQSNNTANSTIASYNAFAATAASGFNANRDIATSGFNANSAIATSGFYTAGQIANGGFGTISDIVTTIGKPNITTTVTNGNAGNGGYTGPYSGANSGNNGRIGNDTNRDCSGQNGTTGTVTDTPRAC